MPSSRLQQGVPLAPLTTLGIGGPARWFARAGSIDEVMTSHGWAEAQRMPLFVFGGGSNLVVADEGVDGLVLQMAIAGVTVTQRGDDTIISCGAGESWDGLVALAVARGLAGLECLSGIPGTVGGTPIQNVGAYGQEVAATIESVTTFDRTTRTIVVMSAKDCAFSYRMSRFKDKDAGRFVVCEVTFRLRRGTPTLSYPDVINHLAGSGVTSPDVQAVRDAVLEIRRRKGMVIDDADPDTRSVGSFFMNPIVDRRTFERVGPAPHYVMQNDTVKIPAAWLIEQSGFARGHENGPVGLSTKHPLAIINRGGATARDVVRFARRIKTAVADRFGIDLRPEPVFAGFGADPDVEYLRG